MSSSALSLGNLELLLMLWFIFFLNKCVECRRQVDVVFTKFIKAFYTVNYCLLHRELELLGLGSPLLSWLKSYLSDKKQLVKVLELASFLSNNFSVDPKGGNLIPLLFIVFENSIHKWATKAKLLLIADDNIFLKIYSIDSKI